MTKILKKPSLQEYDEGHEDREQKVPQGLLEIGEMIDQKLENRPKVRDKNMWRIWRKETNQLVELYNSKCGFKAYHNVH